VIDPGIPESVGRSGPGRYAAPAVAFALAAIYSTFFLVVWRPSWLPQSWISTIRQPAGLLRNTVVSGVLAAMGWSNPGRDLVHACYLLLVAGLIPWLLMALMGRGRPRDLGTRLPNRYAPRLLAVCFVCSVPFLWWMARSSGMAGFYLPHMRRVGAAAFLSYYFVNMLTEHSLHHGVLLAVLRPGLRWPGAGDGCRSALVAKSGGMLRWLGLAQRGGAGRGWRGAADWLGLARDCGPAILGSALLFGYLHLGKDFRELALSVPGGIALGWLAYRTDSWLTPFVLHLATAGVTLVLMLLAQ